MTDQFTIQLNQITDFVRRYSGIIFFIFCSILLGFAIYSMSSVVITALGDTNDSNTSSIAQKFDQKTIDDIKKLQVSSEVNNERISLPISRPNPLVE